MKFLSDAFTWGMSIVGAMMWLCYGINAARRLIHVCERHRCDRCGMVRPHVRVRADLACCPVPLCNICAGIHRDEIRWDALGNHA